jgi:hypothetical protein
VTSLRKRQFPWLSATASNVKRQWACLRSVGKSGREGWVEKLRQRFQSFGHSRLPERHSKKNVKRAHIPTAICISALESESSALDPAEYGWERDERVRCMVPVTLPPNVVVAPPEVLDMIKCGCTTDTPCLTAMCECHRAHFPWPMFCGCH